MKYATALYPLIILSLLPTMSVAAGEGLERPVLLDPILAQYACIKSASSDGKQSKLSYDRDRKHHHAWIEEQPVRTEEDEDVPAPSDSFTRIHKHAAAYHTGVYDRLRATTPLINDICKLIVAYANPAFTFSRKIRLYNRPIFVLRMPHEGRTLACADNIYQTTFEWDMHNATIFDGGIAPIEVLHPIIQPLLLVGTPPNWLIEHAISPNKAHAAAIDHNGIVTMWSNHIPLLRAIKNKKIHRLTTKSFAHHFITMRFSPCSSFLALGALDGSVNILDVRTGHELYSFNTEDSVTALEFSPDGATLMAGLSNGYVSIWQGEPLSLLRNLKDKRGHSDGPSSAVMADDQESSIQLLGSNSPDYSNDIFARHLYFQDNAECDKHISECCAYCCQGCSGHSRCTMEEGQWGLLCFKCGCTCVSCLTSCPAHYCWCCKNSLEQEGPCC